MMVRKHGDSPTLLRRFYKQAETRDRGVHLDGKPLSTPGRAALILPTDAAAAMVAGEWAAQVEVIDFATMPATRHAYTAIDRVAAARNAVIQEIARYAGSDLLCYFAEAPQPLVQRQALQWSPLLNWAEQTLGLAFLPTEGISPQPQPPETITHVEYLAAQLDDFRLSAVAFGAALFGSAILSLALERGRLTGEQAFDLSRLDEAFQEEQWGIDEEAAERTANQRAEAVMLDRWLQALS
jgi:chaperone required for assembly of F1-ATPase